MESSDTLIKYCKVYDFHGIAKESVQNKRGDYNHQNEQYWLWTHGFIPL